jgi:hypothetical protein
MPNTPVVTDVPIIGKGDGADSFKLMGNLSYVWVELSLFCTRLTMEPILKALHA